MIGKLHKRKLAAGGRGFTIIEVMIVLAIAGLIMLIVFLAVPAAQRGARNQQRRTDVGALLGAVAEYTNNNSGLLPGAVSVSGSTAYFCAASPCGTSGTPANLAYYNQGTVSVTSTVPASAPDVNTVYIIKTATCNGNTPTTSGASVRSVVAYFSVEPGAAPQCQGS